MSQFFAPKCGRAGADAHRRSVSRGLLERGRHQQPETVRRVAPAEHRDAGLPVRRARAARRLGTLQSDRGRPFRAGENTRASSSPAGFLRGSLEGGPERGGGQPAATPASRHSASEAPCAPRLHQGHRTAPTTTAVLSAPPALKFLSVADCHPSLSSIYLLLW